jgi:hypothetical protein
MIAGAVLSFAFGARACTVIVPMPREGETWQQAAIRTEGEEQRNLTTLADAVYLARATREPQSRRSRLVTITTMLGIRPPARSVVRDHQACGSGWSSPEGSVIVFASRIDINDAPWKPWRWGRWVVIGWLPPSAIVDPRLAASLKAASVRLEHLGG